MKPLVFILVPWVAWLVVACAPQAADDPPHAAPAAPAAPTASATPPAYAIADTQVLDIHSERLDRDYQLYVALPESYAAQPQRRYPVVFVTDATYAFPLARAISRRVGDHGQGLEEFILVGLSYAKGDTPVFSRRRDYTPTAHGPSDAKPDDSGRPVEHGGAEAYRLHLRDEVFPVLARSYRVDTARKIFAGHSYGALLGTHILFAQPDMFSHYILGSPSLWYDGRVMFKREADYAAAHRDLSASVYLGAGSFETLARTPGTPRFNDTVDLVGDMQVFARKLTSRRYPGLRLESEVIAEEDHLTVAPVLITRGLRRALPPIGPGTPR